MVSDWSIDELDEACFGGQSHTAEIASLHPSEPSLADRPNSAYMLFYERKDVASTVSFEICVRVGSIQKGKQSAECNSAPCSGQAASTLTAPVPFGMPKDLYEDLLRHSLRIIHKSHLHDSNYSQFVQAVVDEHCGLDKPIMRKNRRLHIEATGGVLPLICYLPFHY